MTTLPIKLSDGSLAQFTPADQLPPENLGTGARDGSKFLRDDGVWEVPPGASGAVSSINGKVGNLQLSLGGALAAGALDPGKKAASVALSNNNLTATFSGAAQAVVLGDVGRLTGKLYFEVQFVSGSASGNCGLGLAPSTEPLNSQVGYDGGVPGEIGIFQNSGNVYADNGTNVGAAQSFSTAGDVVCVAVDCDARLAWFKVNNGSWNGSASNSTATGAGGFTVSGTADIFPALSSDSSAVFTANFGGASFSYVLPTGFSPWARVGDQKALSQMDVLVASPVAGQALVFDGQNWINGTVSFVSGSASLSRNDAPAAPTTEAALLFGRHLAGRVLPAAISAAGASEILQPATWRKKIASWNPPGNSTTVPGVLGMNAPTVAGTATARNVATTNLMSRTRRLGYVSATTAGTVAGLYGTLAQWTVGDGAGLGGFLCSFRFAFSDAAAVSGARAFVGMSSNIAAPTNVDPAVQTNQVGVAQLSTDATQLYLVYGGSAAQAAIPLGKNFPPMAAAGATNGIVYDLTLYSPPGENGAIYYMLERVGTSFVASGKLTPATPGTQTPAASTLLVPRVWRSNNATALAVGLDVVGIYIETDQ